MIYRELIDQLNLRSDCTNVSANRNFNL